MAQYASLFSGDLLQMYLWNRLVDFILVGTYLETELNATCEYISVFNHPCNGQICIAAFIKSDLDLSMGQVPCRYLETELNATGEYFFLCIHL